MLNILVNAVAESEKLRGNAMYGEFNSNHEAYAVLKEEIEEFLDCVELYRLKKNLKEIWELVKYDDIETLKEEISLIHVRLEHTSMEALQCLAMLKKWQEHLETYEELGRE